MLALDYTGFGAGLTKLYILIVSTNGRCQAFSGFVVAIFARLLMKAFVQYSYIIVKGFLIHLYLDQHFDLLYQSLRSMCL